jgi:uncharacterized membrane protein
MTGAARTSAATAAMVTISFPPHFAAIEATNIRSAAIEATKIEKRWLRLIVGRFLKFAETVFLALVLAANSVVAPTLSYRGATATRCRPRR